MFTTLTPHHQLTANIPKRYLKLGTTGKSVPGVKAKVTPLSDAHVTTPRLESGASSDSVGEVTSIHHFFYVGPGGPLLISMYERVAW